MDFSLFFPHRAKNQEQVLSIGDQTVPLHQLFHDVLESNAVKGIEGVRVRSCHVGLLSRTIARPWRLVERFDPATVFCPRGGDGERRLSPLLH